MKFILLATMILLAAATSVQAGQLFPPDNIGPNPNVSCPPDKKVLGWTGNSVECTDPVSVACPAGKVMTGVSGGVATCKAEGHAGCGWVAPAFGSLTVICPAGMYVAGLGYEDAEWTNTPDNHSGPEINRVYCCYVQPTP